MNLPIWWKWRAVALAMALLQMGICLDAHSLSSVGDAVLRLPGQPQVRFQQFSGYVEVDNKSEKALFYYFVESDTDPTSKPLVLWLNGGPGCSSLGVGAFSENGPFRPNGEVLIENTSKHAVFGDTSWSWILLCQRKLLLFDGKRRGNRDNLVFLIRWFNKFPHYRHRDLFLTGESYAGHYVPQLAKLMIEMNKKEKIFNLKGVALGNPLLEYATDFNSRAEFFWSHGLISDSTYKMFTKVCNYSRYVSEYYRDSVSPLCSKVMHQVGRETSKFVDKYDVTLDVCISSVLSQSKVVCPQTQQANEMVDVCVDDKVTNYLNQKDVREALHARLVGVRKWDVCSNILDYDMLNLEVPTLPLVGSLVKAGVQVLIYSGDQDSVLPLTGSRILVRKLARKLELNTTVPYRVWFAGQQVGGWTQVYENILSFATVRGASHEVPFSQPERSLVLFKSFLEGMPLPDRILTQS